MGAIENKFGALLLVCNINSVKLKGRRIFEGGSVMQGWLTDELDRDEGINMTQHVELFKMT